jgi:hypothetical protein
MKDRWKQACFVATRMKISEKGPRCLKRAGMPPGEIRLSFADLLWSGAGFRTAQPGVAKE